MPALFAPVEMLHVNYFGASASKPSTMTPVSGPIRIRRGSQNSVGHAEHQFARKSTGKPINANDERFALAA